MTRMHSIGFCSAFAAAILFAGCPAEESEEQSYNDAPKNTDTHGNDHHHELGPHGGHVIELTDDESFHGELTFDAESRTITFYVLGGDLETAVAIETDGVLLHLEDSDDEVTMTAAPQDGDVQGKASAFTLSGDDVPAEIDDIEKIHGHVHVTIDGKDYAGDIEHNHGDDAHHDDDDDHDHKGDDDEDHADSDGDSKKE